ncbi:MAG: hypothetical protein KF878_32095 [Planctomycetes bacterium]|nr:hypothetical protein [Planctomycetota bacterium]
MIDRDNLLECLRELADETFQQRVWSGRVPDQMSSFPELVCQTFDDTGLSEALSEGLVEAELGAEVASLLERLEAAVGRVDQSLPLEQLLVSQALREVRSLSKQIIAGLDPQAGSR